MLTLCGCGCVGGASQSARDPRGRPARGPGPVHRTCGLGRPPHACSRRGHQEGRRSQATAPLSARRAPVLLSSFQRQTQTLRSFALLRRCARHAQSFRWTFRTFCLFCGELHYSAASHHRMSFFQFGCFWRIAEEGGTETVSCNAIPCSTFSPLFPRLLSLPPLQCFLSFSPFPPLFFTVADLIALPQSVASFLFVVGVGGDALVSFALRALPLARTYPPLLSRSFLPACAHAQTVSAFGLHSAPPIVMTHTYTD